MTPEQIDRTIQFLVDQQAQLTANVQKHDEAIAALERNAARHDREIERVADLIGRVAIAETGLVERMEALDRSFSTRMDALAEAQRGSEERLNAFITFVEKYISSRNGGAERS